MIQPRLLLFSATVLLFSPTAFGLSWNLFHKLCPEDAIELPELLVELTEDRPIPVGCEVVDCCPGCPGPGPLDWKIRLDAQFLKGAELRFEGLGRKQLADLKMSGNVELTERGTLVLGGGEVSISGLPAEVDGRVPVAFFTPLVQESFDMDQAPAAAPDTTGAGDIADGVEILQYRGPYVVNTFRSKYLLRPCWRPRRGDQLDVNNNISNDSTIAVLDFRDAGGCVNDTIVRTTDIADLGSVMSNGACNADVSVFSDDNAMAFDTAVTTWTDSTGDKHVVDLGVIITVPVSVWVADNAQLAAAQNDIANANLLYNQNNVGVQFNATITNVSGNAAAVTQIGTWCPTAATVGALQGSTWYTANTLNAYYVNSAFTGVNCGQDRNMQFIGTTANLGSLPHEFGHAYGLRPSASWGHTNGVAGFGNNNIMWGGGPGTRNWFTIGQSFRINTDTTSMLNVNGDRTGSTRTCLPNASSNVCPVLTLDSVPH